MGLMGIIANAAFDNGGVVEGTITNHLADKEKKNLNISSIDPVSSKGKVKKNRYGYSKRLSWKKAYVRVEQGQEIDFSSIS